ncbi:scarecrow-like protein 30 [Lactuca sativa]|nr:scarecrow-like protein 30 [Lactuca sativa]XP_023757262.1 scarecrow-like protein 30 [Lactuca sativa]XP_023757263.1 scarecrow-like protein 30 [Lactuca sativa]XP_023757264.1 scarecrow-like protein 30 [Lactuca sativa]XP_023757265.1 scarecrow-like protein 30 [Lactuca sativa]XP_023757266.1 scarecrow-like protein 30 [Lactuca sativa]XP_042755489.1 scarecrow-like protein 30 [Lactuca sativa]XP_042755490.1 scarecrow-like protein 30 [Lactuca sativa]XP_042755491.1 scarecrow-like protein 30 [Lactuca s
MVMDGLWKADYRLSTLNAAKFNGSATVLSDQKFLNAMSLNETFLDRNSTTHTPELPDLGLRRFSPSSSSNNEGDLHEDFDLSDVVFKYINQMLMEEDIEEKTCMLHESAALQAAEKSFYDALMVNDPPFCSPHPTVPLYDNDGREEITLTDYNSFISGTSSLSCDVSDYDSPLVPNVSINLDSQSRSQSSYCSSSCNSNGIDSFTDSPLSIQSVSDILGSSRSDLQFQKDIGGLSRFLLSNENKEEANDLVIKAENKQETNSIPERTRGKKNPYPKDVDDDGRTSKQSAVYTEPTVRSKMFDDVLLCNGGKNHLHCDVVPNGVNGVQQKGNGGKGGRGKKGVKKDVVDLRTLLSLCAQAIAANDQRSAVDLLKQIRDNSSPTGDGMQRLAHYFSIGLEARMAGSGTEIYKTLLFRPTSAVDVLKAYHLYLSCCPFIKISNFFSNKTILHTTQNKKKVHIVDFGILYGFQWPCFIQRLSTRPGGPPELRITGIDFPCPGFRPSQRVEETGRRLANYAETFNVPFKFKAIAQKWETITIEDLELDTEETLIVNCAYRFRYLLDETVMVDSPRNKVVNLIRKMKPDMFIQGVVNGSYNAPFFITRFREALFFFSSLFDMIEASVGREVLERMLIEKGIWGQEAMNVIACEGGERIARPETYKQWQVRNMRAGFRQLPLNQEILKMAMERARSRYHRDFGIDEDGHWMLQGWKGRIMVALSCWKPV